MKTVTILAHSGLLTSFGRAQVNTSGALARLIGQTCSSTCEGSPHRTSRFPLSFTIETPRLVVRVTHLVLLEATQKRDTAIFQLFEIIDVMSVYGTKPKASTPDFFRATRRKPCLRDRGRPRREARMGKPLDIEQAEALLAKNQALVARERERVNELKTQNADTLQEICSSLVVPTSAFGMSYVRAYFGERASIAGIPINAGVGLILKIVAACFGASISKGGQRVGQFFHDIANGALASWTAALGAEFGAKKRLEKPEPLPVQQPNVGAVRPAQETPKFASGPMTFEDLAAITAARQQQPAVAPPAPPPNVGVAGLAQETPKPASSPTVFENIAAMAAGMFMTPRAPQQSVPTPAPQSAHVATQAAPPTGPQSPPQPPPGAPPTPPANPPKPYRFAQSRAARLPDVAAAFAGKTCSRHDLDKDMQWLSTEYSSENLASILKWAAAPT